MTFIKTILSVLKRKRIVKKINKNTHSNFSTKTSLNNADVEGYNASRGTVYLQGSKIGYGTYFGTQTRLTRSKIGRFCSIGINVSVVECKHPTDRVSTYPIFYSNASFLPLNMDKKSFDNHASIDGFNCIIGNDVWIGNNVLIRGGTIIGDGAIIAMGSVVVKDVPPYAIVGGNPAKIIRFRFTESEISSLLNIKWWNWSIEKIKENCDLFDDPESFIEKSK